MKHMKRMLMILAVLAAAGAVYVYVVPYIMNRRAENVEVQSYSNGNNGPCNSGYCPQESHQS
jgi:NADH:ubiquinone oxidoreductase subunit 3 (subunit A)